ncbi:adenylate/guanylate cyclase domain-containing protein, partial [Chitinimonas sp.]|uniref:adenylate/guanylate cyclase domain-containing protein n=1 Tax=Chitinimonas sp. TaxID=1934313 RepID=UPI0035B1CF77
DGLVRAVLSGPATLVGAVAPAGQSLQQCGGKPCQPLRFSSAASAAIPLSMLSSCDQRWQQLADSVRNRVVVLQLTDDNTPEDIHMTPAGAGIHGLRAGARIVEDGVATALAGDGPRPAPTWLSGMLTAVLVLLGIAACSRLRPALALAGVGLLLLMLLLAAPFVYPWAYWPVDAMLAALLAAMLLIFAGHMKLRTWQSGVFARFLPPQARHLLLVEGQLPALVLMSDIAEYAALTSRQPSAAAVFQLVNAYIETVSQDMQEHYGAWLESYVGDMVCYYWPRLVADPAQWQAQHHQALQAARAMQQRQQRFFREVARQAAQAGSGPLSYAGIALVEGEVCMGEIGPANGIRKFGILGDPLNLASRMEALTRYFNARLLVTDSFVAFATEQGMLARRIARIRVRGRDQAMDIWALHESDDAISAADIADWQRWLEQAGWQNDIAAPVETWALDAASLRAWYRAGRWQAEEAYFDLNDR